MLDQPTRHVRSQSDLLDDVRKKVRELVEFREVLPNLVRKELKVRYKNSVLGFVWSMLNPLLYLVVFFVVFSIFLPSTIPDYHVYLLSGLLPWTFFSIGLLHATVSIVGAPDLVKKVYFPRELLPISSLGAALIHFFLQVAVLAIFLLVTGYGVASAADSLLLPLSLLAQALVLVGLSLFFSSANVKARDAQHFLELGLLALFWMTPIVYPSALAAAEMRGYQVFGISLLDLYLANPLTRVVLAFQRGIYGPRSATDGGMVLIDEPFSWYIAGLGYTALVGLVLLLIGWWVFHRLDPTFAEEL